MKFHLNNPHVIAHQVMRSLGAVFLGTALLSLATTTASAEIFKFYSGKDVRYKDGWDLFSERVRFGISLKPGRSATSPPLETTYIARYGVREYSTAVVYQHHSYTPADSANLIKTNHTIMDYGSPDTMRVDVGNFRYLSFFLMFDKDFVTCGRRDGAILFQAHQGGGSPPLCLKTDESNGHIRLKMQMRNDSNRGGPDPSAEVYLKDAFGNDKYFSRNFFYHFVIQARFDPLEPGTRALGKVNVWINTGGELFSNDGAEGDTSKAAVRWGGYLGYKLPSTPHPSTPAGCSVLIGPYNVNYYRVWGTPYNTKVHFDQMKFSDTVADAKPDLSGNLFRFGRE